MLIALRGSPNVNVTIVGSIVTWELITFKLFSTLCSDLQNTALNFATQQRKNLELFFSLHF